MKCFIKFNMTNHIKVCIEIINLEEIDIYSLIYSLIYYCFMLEVILIFPVNNNGKFSHTRCYIKNEDDIFVIHERSVS